MILSNITEYTNLKLSPCGLSIIIFLFYILRIVNEQDVIPSLPHNDR